MNVITIIPPLVQLNTPYPSGAYLTSFFKKMNCTAVWYDLSIELYYSIFSREGLTKLFQLTSEKALKMADESQKFGDTSTAFNLRRYVSTASAWISNIDSINSILTGHAREKEHQFLFSPFAPRGNRMESFLSNLDHDPTVDDVRFLCSYALADLADYITAVYDANFSLIRYAEAVTTDARTFEQIESELDAPILRDFYTPVLDHFFAQADFNSPTLICISIPFAGTYIPALFTARYLKQKFGSSVKISIGGGYVNTELRDFSNPSLGKYVDYISYDRGYGSYKELIERFEEKNQLTEAGNPKPIYKLTQFVPQVRDKSTYKTECKQNFLVVNYKSSENAPQIQQFESNITTKITPDYADIDFSRYLRVCDDKNPMHRLWTDGSWIKAYLAHGCYWHKCAFCDTNLDYVCGYKMVDVENLYESLLQTAREKNIYGIHFVDEALPPAALKRFAICNARHGNPLYFWGNVRFEKTFTKDFAAFLSYCGFGAVSAGIEVATGTGLKNVNKGTDLQSIVSACAAFKEAGILVHSYMIYGFWYDNAQTIIDSMETLRQFFAAGLLDSAFWHQFMLTKNSELYPKLKDTFTTREAEKFKKFGPSLDAAVDSWMQGQKLEMKVQKWFNFPVPTPTVGKDFVEKMIEKYEIINNGEWIIDNLVGELYWLGSELVVQEGKTPTLTWFYLQEEYTLPIKSSSVFHSQCSIINSLSPTATPTARESALEQIKKSPELIRELQRFHNKGLVLIDN